MPYKQGFYNLPQFIGKNYPETDVLVCFRVFIPEGDIYKQQLLALINVAATKAAWWTENDDQRYSRAEMWQAAYRKTVEKMDCGCEDCEWLIECLENEDFLAALDAAIAGLLNDPESATSQAVAQITQNALGNQQGLPLPESLTTQTLNDGADTCDKNTLWGSCLFTVVSLNRLNEDFLETMEALTDNQEMLAFVVGAIPVLETLPIDEFIEMADKIRSFVAETYAAGYDADLESQMACALFCAAVDNDCKLTMELIFNYFKAQAASVTGFEDVWDGARTIIHAFASWEETVGEGVVFVMMACNVGFMTFLNSALGMDFGHFKLKAKAGIPSDDWEVFCTDCPEAPVPVLETIGGACWSGNSGTDLTDLGSGNWSAVGELYIPDNVVRVTVKRSDDGVFKFDNFASNVGIGGAGWVLADDTCTAGAGVFPPVNTGLKSFVLVIQNTGTPLEISFSFYE